MAEANQDISPRHHACAPRTLGNAAVACLSNDSVVAMVYQLLFGRVHSTFGAYEGQDGGRMPAHVVINEGSESSISSAFVQDFLARAHRPTPQLKIARLWFISPFRPQILALPC